MLNILHVSSVYLPYIGGASLRIRNLLNPLIRDNLCEFHILVPTKDIHGKDIYHSHVMEHEIIDGIFVHRSGKISNMMKEIRNICNKTNIDLIHAHNPRFALMCLIALTGKPLILEIHTIKQFSLFKELLAKLTYKLCHRIIVLSDSMKETIVKSYNQTSDRVQVIHNGVDIERFIQSKNNNIKDQYSISEKYVIGYIGTFYKWQGVEDLLISFSKIIKIRDDVRLFLVGDGPEYNNLLNIIQDLDIENNVTLTGIISPDEIPHYLSLIDIFIIPRPRTLETETAVPLKLLEAMAAEKAIIATNVGGLSEIIEDGFNGILTDPSNPNQMADKILSLIDNELLRNNIVEKAKQKVKEYSWELSAMKLFSIYNDILC